jgi:5'-nucleotidase/UDP-sugar diphosphatase
VGTTLLGEREAAIARVAAVSALGVNKIVLLTHIGLTKDLEWMAGIEGVDAVVGGDSHTLLEADVAQVFMAQGEYPTVTTTKRQSNGCPRMGLCSLVGSPESWLYV